MPSSGWKSTQVARISNLPAAMVDSERSPDPAASTILIPVATGLALRDVMRTTLPAELRARGLTPVFAVPRALHATLSGEAAAGELSVDVLPDPATPAVENLTQLRADADDDRQSLAVISGLRVAWNAPDRRDADVLLAPNSFNGAPVASYYACHITPTPKPISNVLPSSAPAPMLVRRASA